MIRRITDLAPYLDFIRDVQNDPDFADPMLVTEEEIACNLYKSAAKPDNRVWGVFRGDWIVGFFLFLVIPAEQYMEMIVGLSREIEAYDELLSFLAENYPGYQADFVFNPRNTPLKERLAARGATFEVEQLKMVYTHAAPPVDVDGVELLSPRYHAGYLNMHTPDMYWTGDKVIAAPERFRTLVAVKDGEVIGYIDVTHCFQENEPYDLLVKAEYRRMGYGRRLLAQALTLNEPNDMMLLVDIDNVAAIRLYESMGFIARPAENNLTVHWQIPARNADALAKERKSV